MWGLMYKPAPSLRTRILKALQLGPARGQGELMQRVLGAQFSIGDQQDFNATLRSLLAHPADIREVKAQLPGTGHEGPPVFEYTYSLWSKS